MGSISIARSHFLFDENRACLKLLGRTGELAVCGKDRDFLDQGRG